MDLETAQLILFEGFACTIFWTCLCRQRHMTKRNTLRDIRWAFTLLGIVAILFIVSPVYQHKPDSLEILLLASIAIVQLVTAHHWRNGTPSEFRQKERQHDGHPHA